MNQRFIAVWKYDLPPYYLAGEVVEFLGSYVRVKEYDCGVFTPVKVVPFEVGEKFAAELRELEYGYRREDKKLREAYRRDAEKLLGLVRGDGDAGRIDQ